MKLELQAESLDFFMAEALTPMKPSSTWVITEPDQESEQKQVRFIRYIIMYYLPQVTF